MCLVSTGSQSLHSVGVLGEQWVQEGGEQASQDTERGQHHGGCLEQWAGGVDLRVGNVLLGGEGAPQEAEAVGDRERRAEDQAGQGDGLEETTADAGTESE